MNTSTKFMRLKQKLWIFYSNQIVGLFTLYKRQGPRQLQKGIRKQIANSFHLLSNFLSSEFSNALGFQMLGEEREFVKIWW